ncbi:sensor domain-containing diguanylate cyclase [Paraglaciecola marina]|uniref:GGDEF domain-containing protein n=1 Tax=Paraglaciecola marina TaxID=2500157 RepID=UPI001EF083BA|nr:diguanylate cyclase [Paraglaciecola marina]
MPYFNHWLLQVFNIKLLRPFLALLLTFSCGFNLNAQQISPKEQCHIQLLSDTSETKDLPKNIALFIQLATGENRLRLSCTLNEQAIFTFGKDEILNVTLNTGGANVEQVLANSPSYILPAGTFEIEFIFLTHHKFLQQFSWLSTATFFNSNLINNITMGAFYGLSLTLIFYVFFMGRVLGDNRFQFYSLYTFCAATFFLLQEGQLNIVLPKHSFLLSHQFYLLFAGLTVVTAVLFIVRLTDLKKEWPKVTRYFLEPGGVLVLLMSVMMLQLDHNALSAYLGQGMSKLTLALMLCIFILVAVQAYAKKRMANWVLFSLSLMVLAMLFRTFLQDYSPFLHRYALIFAFSIEAFILAVVVLTKVKNIKQDKLLAELQANTDELCNVLNRRGWEHKANQILIEQRAKGGVSALVYLDLNSFKQINDNLGHDVGDKVLMLIASEISEQLGTDEHLGRIGGDEFVIAAYFRSEEAAQYFRDKIVNNLKHFALKIDEKLTLDVTCSLGCKMFNEAPKSIRDMLILADESMYQVKQREKKNAATGLYSKT